MKSSVTAKALTHEFHSLSPFIPIKDNSIFASLVQGLMCRLATVGCRGGRLEGEKIKERQTQIDCVGKGRELLLENKTCRKWNRR